MQLWLFLLCKQIPGTRNLNMDEHGEYGCSEESKWICETRHMRALIWSCPSITSIQKKYWNLEISVSSSSVVMSSHILRSFLGLATNGGSHCLKGNLYEHVRNVSWTCLCSCMSIRIFEKQVHAKPCTCRHVYIIKDIHTYTVKCFMTFLHMWIDIITLKALYSAVVGHLPLCVNSPPFIAVPSTLGCVHDTFPEWQSVCFPDEHTDHWLQILPSIRSNKPS